MTDYVRQHKTAIQFSSGESWVILSPIEQQIKAKIEKVGTPLKDWDISINYGIKTGCNEAFIINRQKRDELIAKDAKSADIIRPILRGRDIARYQANFANLYLINTHNGIPAKKLPPVDVSKYPAIKQHLDLFWDKISKRDDKGITPYNLRSCAYTEDFSYEKITWGNLNLSASFTLAPANMYINAPATMIIPADKYLLGILNSKLADYYIRNLGVTRNGGYFEYKPMFISQLPVPQLSEKEKQAIISIVSHVMFSDKQSHNICIQDFEKQIDELVFKLYGLTNEEINFIESR